MEHFEPQCDNCGGLEFELVEDPDTETTIPASEYFAKLAAGTPTIGEPGAHTAICKGCQMQYPC